MNEQQLIEAVEKLDLKEDILDVYCDPENPVVVGFPEVSAAAYKIKGGIDRTPCTVSEKGRHMKGLLIFADVFNTIVVGFLLRKRV